MPISPEHSNWVKASSVLVAALGFVAFYNEVDSRTVATAVGSAEEIETAARKPRNNVTRQAGILAAERIFADRASRSADITTTTLSTTTTSAPVTTTTSSPPRTTTILAAAAPEQNAPVVEGEWARTDLGTFESTCYALPPKGTQGGPGSIAVDPRVIPMGTELEVEQYGRGAARDTGGAIKGRIIDVWKPTEAECRQWGRRMVQVTKLERVG